jgi:hypothetical protein
MRGPRSIAESASSSHYERFPTSASIDALYLPPGSASYAGSVPDESFKLSREQKLPAFSHHPSTRHMVEKYERMCTPPGDRLVDTNCSRGSHDGQALSHRQGGDSSATLEKKDKKSPLRQSIRNLLSTLRKGASRSGEVINIARAACKHDTETLRLDRPPQVPEKDRNVIVHSTRNRENTLPQQLSLAERHPLPSFTSHVPTADHDKVDFSGPVWYLCQSSSEARATWCLCSGVIKNRKLSITWFSHKDSNHRVLEVDLVRCMEVRTLTSGDIEEAELAILCEREETRELKIFELISQSREKDRFAVRNLGERAAWVSALW